MEHAGIFAMVLYMAQSNPARRYLERSSIFPGAKVHVRHSFASNQPMGSLPHRSYGHNLRTQDLLVSP